MATSHSARIPYTKPALPPAGLLAHLVSRGLVVSSAMEGVAALGVLERIDYYRLLGYMRSLQASDTATGRRRFIPGTTIRDLLAVYEFDRRLRLLCMEAVEHVEVALRAMVVSEIAVPEGAHFYLDARHFKRPELSARFQEAVRKEEQHSRAIRHYKARYSHPVMPPVWAAMEAVTFGALSHLYSNLNRKLRLRIARRFQLDEGVLGSWLRSVNGIRNISAHHGRLWNAPLHVDQPRPGNPFSSEFNPQPSTFYDRAIVLVVLLDRVHAGSGWKSRFLDLLDTHPLIDTSLMGFPADWRARPFWRFSRKPLNPRRARHRTRVTWPHRAR